MSYKSKRLPLLNQHFTFTLIFVLRLMDHLSTSAAFKTTTSTPSALALPPSNIKNNKTTSQNIQAKNVCNSEYLNVDCGDGSVIVTMSADYGRMEINRCAIKNFGFIGCKSDVLRVVDKICSGRRSCRFRVLDETFGGVHRCHEDLKSYLEVTYTCVRVTLPPGLHQSCRDNDHAPLLVTSPSGYIASSVSEFSGCGLADAPWILEVKAGQRINITLIDFTHDPDNMIPLDRNEIGPKKGGMLGMDGVCRVYATIREVADSRSTTVCAKDDRIRNVYISSTNRVEVRILNSQPPTQPSYFLLKYQAFGCPILEPPLNGWIQQDDSVAHFGCDFNDKTWRLNCVTDTWTGTNNTCVPESTVEPSDAQKEGFLSLSVEMCIVLIIILAFSVGLFILILGLLCIKWKHLPACCRCAHVIAGGNKNRSRDQYTMKGNSVVTDPACGPPTYTYATKLAGTDLIYHQDHDYACSRLLGNVMPDIMHNQDQPLSDSHALGHCHDVYDSPCHTMACQQRIYDTSPCSLPQPGGNNGNHEGLLSLSANQSPPTNQTSPIRSKVSAVAVENPYGSCVQHYIDMGPTNCVNLVPCTAGSYLAPVTITTDQQPLNVAPNCSTSTFGKPQIRDVAYMSTTEVAASMSTTPTQSCVTVNDGTCTVSVCDSEVKPFDDTYSSVVKNNKV